MNPGQLRKRKLPQLETLVKSCDQIISQKAPELLIKFIGQSINASGFVMLKGTQCPPALLLSNKTLAGFPVRTR